MKIKERIKNKYIKLVFAIVVCLTSVLFTTNTYALPLYSMYDAPATITRIPIEYSYFPNGATSGVVPNFEAQLENKKYKVFCLDRHGDYNDADKLVKKGEVPYPLTYIALNTIPYVNYDMNDTTNKVCKDAENIWIGQTAIWYYLDNKNIDAYRKSGKLNLVKGDDEGDETFNYGIEETGNLNYVNGDRTIVESMAGSDPNNSQCTKFGKDLWNAAVALANTAVKANDPSKNLTFNLSKSEVSKTEDGKSYKTELVKFETTAPSNIESYKLEIPNAPKDTKVYDQNSNEITDLNNIDGNRSFYIVIPKTSFSSEKINFNIKVTANFNFVKGYYYEFEDESSKKQPVMLLGNESATKSAELVFSDDTALNISNSIYFIGFVILISGAGIIYANVRPRTKESEY